MGTNNWTLIFKKLTHSLLWNYLFGVIITEKKKKKKKPAYRRGLVAKAAKMRVDGTIHSFWTIDGKVFVKTSPDGSPTKINDEADFNYL